MVGCATGPTRHCSWLHFLFAAIYRDVFALEDDGWRIVERNVVMDQPGTLPAVVDTSPQLRVID